MSVDMAALLKSGMITEVETLRDEIKKAVEPLSEKQLWTKPVDPGNSAGHLILHLTGNLNHFVGAQLGGTGYVRDREREFTETQTPPKAALVANFDAAVATFRRVVESLTPERLASPHPEKRLGVVAGGLIHLVAHFALHRGQISYIVRLLK